MKLDSLCWPVHVWEKSGQESSFITFCIIGYEVVTLVTEKYSLLGTVMYSSPMFERNIVQRARNRDEAKGKQNEPLAENQAS